MLNSRKTLILTVLALLVLGVAFRSSVASGGAAEDEAAIRDHVRQIFDAFVRQDREAIRALHSEDWIGFFVGSDAIVRGIDGYMENVTFRFPMKSYELEQEVVRVNGDTAALFYVARVQSANPSGGEDLDYRLRSVDLYRRDSNGWIQSGSHIALVPPPGGWGRILFQLEENPYAD